MTRPPLPGFSDNPFQSRDDILRAATSFLKPLTPYKSACGARIKLPIATGTGFDEISAQLEGFARPLWVVADLLSIQAKAPKTPSTTFEKEPMFEGLDLESWIRGLSAGVDPESDSFWGHLGNHDQRMVEMEPIAYALLSAPSVFSLSPEVADQKKFDNLRTWLSSINERVMPPSNWRWFRVLVNLALIKFCGVPYNVVKPVMDADFEVLDSCYLGEGWSSDGVWSEDKKQVDYYSGSFAIQYSQLAYVRFAADIDPERVERYRKQARDFSETFWRYFDVDGAAIPFGRSLTYRFTFAAFWSAVTVAGVDLPSPLNELGVVKGILLRHLRWWAKQNGFFNTDGTLCIGYTYPNMYMSEDYNSPQSTYWCLKTFAVLGLPEDHPFWSCEELPHPLSKTNQPQFDVSSLYSKNSSKGSSTFSQVGVVAPAMHIVCGFPDHHFLLSSGQFTKKPHKAREAKYGKFAYSSAFAFSVPTGNVLEQIAPDSTLCVSNDDGDTWKVRWDPIDARVRKLNVSLRGSEGMMKAEEIAPVLVSKWKPWKISGLVIQTTLVPPLANWPGWHVRIHRLSWPVGGAMDLKCVDSGFAISSQTSNGGVLPNFVCGPEGFHATKEGVWEDSLSCLILSDAGASGAFNLKSGSDSHIESISKGSILKPDSNTNLIAQRTSIPTINHYFPQHIYSPGVSTLGSMEEAWFASGIFAVTKSAGLDPTTIRSMWNSKPVFNLRKADGGIIKMGTGDTADIWSIGDLWTDSS